MTSLSDQQRAVLVAVGRTSLAWAEAWYRAGEGALGLSEHGEAVTLASLYRKGLLKRRAYRGKDGEPNAAYEYRVSDVVMAELEKRTVAEGAR